MYDANWDLSEYLNKVAQITILFYYHIDVLKGTAPFVLNSSKIYTEIGLLLTDEKCLEKSTNCKSHGPFDQKMLYSC